MKSSYGIIWLDIFIFIFCITGKAYPQIIINELMAAPTGDEPEWVELYNYSASALSLTNSFIEDAISSKPLPVITIPAGGYALLTKDTTALKAARKIPKSALLFEINLPILNNDKDIILIRDDNSSIIDSVFYNMNWGKKGISLERIDRQKPAVSQSNLGPSVSPDSATAGYENSIRLKDFKIDFIISYQTEALKVTAKNSGRNPLSDIVFSIFVDADRNMVSGENEKVLENSYPLLQVNDSISEIIAYSNIYEVTKKSGKFLLFIKANAKLPSAQYDSTVTFVNLPYPSGSLLINEFMFDPGEENGEFVEIWNSTQDTISLENYILQDKVSNYPGKGVRIDAEFSKILPESYFVICMDSSFYAKFPELLGNPYFYCTSSSLKLNDDTDEIILRNPNGKIQDSLTYFVSWHNPEIKFTNNISLEKISPEFPSSDFRSWSSSIDARGATPLKRNSISSPPGNDFKLDASPNPFSPFGNGKSNICSIKYEIPFKQSLINAKVYDLSGSLLKIIASGKISPSIGIIEWDGTNDNNYSFQVGPYILAFEATDIASEKSVSKNLLIVIGM